MSLESRGFDSGLGRTRSRGSRVVSSVRKQILYTVYTVYRASPKQLRQFSVIHIAAQSSHHLATYTRTHRLIA